MKILRAYANTDGSPYVLFEDDAPTLKETVENAVKQGASLDYASLDRASLRGASLDYASLRGASLRGATMPFGETWERYLSEVVPALLKAGGKEIADVVKESWECHSWENCPMAVAFSIHRVDDTPLLLRPRVNEFVQFFDAKLIPKPGEGV
jgi:hypothetical protein